MLCNETSTKDCLTLKCWTKPKPQMIRMPHACKRETGAMSPGHDDASQYESQCTRVNEREYPGEKYTLYVRTDILNA